MTVTEQFIESQSTIIGFQFEQVCIIAQIFKRNEVIRMTQLLQISMREPVKAIKRLNLRKVEMQLMQMNY